MNAHSALGTLYAEDFGRSPSPPEAPPPERPHAPALNQGDIDGACRRAVAAARDAWTQEAAERRTMALEALATGVAEAERSAALHAEAVADGIARTALSMVSAVLPHLCHAHGDAEIRAMTRSLLPTLARTATVVARVQAGLLDALRLDLADMDEAVLDRIELRPANLPPGDARLSWEDGSLVRDTAAIRAAILDGLAQLGLDVPTHADQDLALAPAAHDRSLALAQ